MPANPTDLPDSTIAKQGAGRRRWAARAAIGVAVAVVLFFGAIFLYAKVINDSPDEFTAADLDVALSTDTEATAGAGAPPAGTGAWSATGASQVGYRIDEVLFGVDTTAVGRTDQVTGTLTIEGTQVTTTEFTVDVASISSDESRRDQQFSGRIMSADRFPTATFVLTEPIDLGGAPTDGVEVAATATGELTLRGETRPVTFEVTARHENGRIGVQGSIPVVFADYRIANPSFGGIATEDHGLVEFVLVFEPA